MNPSLNVFESFLILIGILAVIVAIVLFVLERRNSRYVGQHWKSMKKK